MPDRKPFPHTAWVGVLSLAGGAWAAHLGPLFPAWLREGGAVLPAFWKMTPAAAAAHAGAGASAALVLFICWTSGRRLRRLTRLAPDNPLEACAADLGLGAALWAQLFFALGLAGLLRGPALWTALAAGAALGLEEAFRRPPAMAAARTALAGAGGPWLALLALHLAVLLPYALVPETFFDALEYHLGLPHLYLLRGRIGPVPDNAFSGVPNLPSMLYGWTLFLEPEGRGAHLLGLTFLPMACMALMGLGARLGSPRSGGLAAALFALSPCVSSSAQMTGVEGAWAFLALASLSAALSAARRPDEAGPWAAAGIIVGAAMSCKTLAWGLPLAVLAASWSAEGRPPARRVFTAALAAACVLAPWLARNWLHYANPLYPFLHERFVPGAEVMPGWRYLGSGATIEWGKGAAEGLRQWLSAPWAMLNYQGRHSDSAGPVLLSLLPVGLWAALREPRWRPVLWFSLAAWLPLSLVTTLPRYLIAAFAPLALAAARAVERDESPVWLRPLTAAALLASAALLWRWALPLSRLEVFTGAKPAAEFLAHSDVYYYPTPLAPAARWLGEHAPPDAKVLLFGDARGFQVPRDHILSTPMQTSVLERWANASADGEALRARFAGAGVGYILVNHGEIVRQNLELRFRPSGKSALDAFWKRFTLKAFSAGPDVSRGRSPRPALDRWVVVYEVLSEEEAARPHEADDLFAGYKVSETVSR